MGSTFMEHNEMPAPNAYETKSENAKRSDSFSRSLQNAPGGYTTDHRGNVTENESTIVSQPHQSGQPGDLLKSARSPHGSPVEVITDDTVVEINGVTATARSAARAGLLQKNPDGSYSEVTPQKAAVSKKKAQRMDPLSRDARAQVGSLGSLIGKANTEHIMHKIAAANGIGKGLGSVSRDLADLAGVSPEETEKMVTEISSSLENEMMHSLVQGTGMTQPQAEDMLSWCYENLPRTHVASIFAGALHGDTQALSSAFEKYRLSQRKQNNQ